MRASVVCILCSHKSSLYVGFSILVSVYHEFSQNIGRILLKTLPIFSLTLMKFKWKFRAQKGSIFAKISSARFGRGSFQFTEDL